VYGVDDGYQPARPTNVDREENVMDDHSGKKWEGRWDQLKGKAKQQWGQLTDDDVDVAEGQYDEFVGRIKERTGEAEERIRERLEA
jgi:uncharacterized protein YjbJ (UPF0337 family)